jgi:hypothetical protein
MSRKSLVLIGILVLTALCLSGCGGGSSPVSVAVTASTSTVDATDAVTLSAAVTNDKNAAGVTWTVSGGGTLSGQTTTAATYTAPAASSTALSVTVTATSVADTTKTGTVTLTVPAAPAITTTSSALAGTVGTAYSVQLAGSGGISPYTWSVVSGSTLPAGLALSTAGVISGTPTAAAAGTTNVNFQIKDSGTATALTATQTLGVTIAAAPAITFTGTMPATATWNVAYTGSALASGGAGALTYSLSSGALPTGLTLAAAAVTGTPTAVGTYNFTIKAADAFGDSATHTYTVVVSYPPLNITTATTLPVGYVGSVYTSTTLAATGGNGAGYAWALASGSSLPAGLSLSAAGVITGTPTGTPGTASVTITVTDSASNTGSSTFSITIKAAVSITTGTTLPTGYVGSNYTQTLAATGGAGTPYTWTVASGSTLPAGLTLSAAGVLSGNPTTVGTPSFAIKATDSASNSATATFNMTIAAGVSITSSSTLPKGYQGTAYPGATLTATGGAGAPYTWTWAAAGGSSLPAGLILSTGGLISGTPTGSGTFSIVVTATDSVGNTMSQTASLTVEPTLTVSTTSPLNSGTISVPYSQTLMATGGSGAGYTWTLTSGASSLAALNLSMTGPLISGTPTTTGTATFAVQVTDSESHTAAATFSVTIYNALTITTTTLPVAYTQAAYSQQLNAGGGTGTGYTWSTTGASNLPTFNLSLSAAGVISGTPTTTGTATFTAKVTDSANNSATAALTITVYQPLGLPAPSATVPGPATVGQLYDGTVTLTGVGSGVLSWTITGLPADGLSSLTSGPTVHVTGTPTSAQTVTFNVTVTDTTTSVSVGPTTYSIVVSNPAPLTLPAVNPSSLPSATVGQAYTGAINATGGASPYTWTVNSAVVPTNGSAVALTNGLSVSNTGGNTLAVGGTPTSSGSVAISASIKDNLGTVAGPNAYTVTVNSAGSQITGQISLSNSCGSVNVPAITVSINTSPVQQVTTDNNGNYTFTAVPNGTYTITPTITGPTSAFYPATQSVTVSNGNLTGENFSVALGYTVSGTVSYAGSKTGRIYLVLGGNCGSGGPGTSLSAAGAFTIHGVSPGTYTAQAWMDNLGYGAQNASNPTGSSSSFTLSNANSTGVAVTLADPSAVTLSTGPTIETANPASGGAVLTFNAIKNSNSVETPTSYTVQWSTTSGFGTVAGSQSFPAIGAHGNGIWIISGLTNGQVYYFRAQGVAGSSTSNFSTVVGPITIGAPSTGNTISGTVTFTGTATGPLYVGFFDMNTSNVYGAVVGSKTSPPTSPATYTVQVPNGSNYYFFGIIDQNNDGIVDAGDITNVNSNSSAVTVITGNATLNLTLPSAGSTVAVPTQHWQSTNGTNTSAGYYLYINVREGNKLPVSATLTSGPNMIFPLDMGACTDCGTPQFSFNASIGSVRPNLGDAYGILVTYSDTTSETLTATVSAVLNAFATSLAPTTGTSTSTTPTFTWTDPASASSYVYEFSISDNSGNQIWQIPGNNSKLNGFSSTITSITWGTDPTNSSNTPTLSSLSTSTTYFWQIQVQDSNDNTAQAQVAYQP